MKLHRLIATVLVAVCASVSVTTPASAGDSARYVSGGTAVARSNGAAVVDEGYVVCDDGHGVGVGGFCVEFGDGNSVEVVDAIAGRNVAFQACIDNNGDGLCTSPDFGACADVTFFSHDDDGSFKNPVGPMPTAFTPSCPGGFPGYVVFLCEGVHNAGLAPHAHAAGSGTGSVTYGGQGSGSFCGGPPVSPSRKPYLSERVAGGGGGNGYRGACRASLATSGEGGQVAIEGAVDVLVAATDANGRPQPTAPISAECELYVNGVFDGVVLTASGTGVAAAGTPFNRSVSGSDVYTLCTSVTVNGGTSKDCQDLVVTQVPPQPLADALEAARAAAKDAAGHFVDPAICPLLAAFTPGIPGLVDITPEGDVYLFGEFAYDCPPYAS